MLISSTYLETNTAYFPLYNKVSVEQGVSKKEGDHPVYYNSENRGSSSVCTFNSKSDIFNCYSKGYIFDAIVTLYGDSDATFAEAPDKLAIYYPAHADGKPSPDKICYYAEEEQTRVCYEKA